MNTVNMKLKDFFKVESSNGIIHGNTVDVIYDIQQPETYAYITRGTVNNGLKGYISWNQNYLNEGNCISFAQDTFSAFYQKDDFFTGNKVKILRPNFNGFNNEIGLYFCELINKRCQTLSWGICSDVKAIENFELAIPVTPDGTPDFDYMTQYIAELETQYIAELETQYIAELETYLKVTGLDDYTLTDSDRDVLSRMADGRVPMGEFHIGDLFDIEKTYSYDKGDLNIKGPEQNYDYVTRTSLNQGICCTTGYINDKGINDSGTFSLGLLQMDFFYRVRPWYAGQFMRKIICKYKINESVALYFEIVLNRLSNTLKSILVRDVDNTFLNIKIYLPVTPDGTPDYAFMEQYIRAVEKQTIAKLYDSHTMEIQTAKEIIDSDI